MAEQIDPSEKSFVIAQIGCFFPGLTILAFGSRIRGGSHRYSDLDIALDAKGPLDTRKLSQLRECLAASNLPFLVDIVDISTVSEEFRRLIESSSAVWG